MSESELSLTYAQESLLDGSIDESSLKPVSMSFAKDFDINEQSVRYDLLKLSRNKKQQQQQQQQEQLQKVQDSGDKTISNVEELQEILEDLDKQKKVCEDHLSELKVGGYSSMGYISVFLLMQVACVVGFFWLVRHGRDIEGVQWKPM